LSLSICLVLAVQHLVTALQVAAPAVRIDREAWLMGTRFQITVYGADRAHAERIGETALREVERIEALLSTWDPTTPLSLVNRMPPGTWGGIEPELEDLLWETDAWSRRSEGAFSARIGALIDAWDLRGPGRIPDHARLSEALASTGSAGVEFADGRVRRASDLGWIDAGAFGKGAALRAAARAVTKAWPLGYYRLLLDLGGQILVLAPPDAAWTVEVAHPRRRSEAVATLSVHARSVSTSGSSERGQHVLDPRTGRPVEPWGSVTVVDSDALAADIASTTLFVMGPVVGPAWARREGIAALFLETVAGRIEATWTPSMKPWLLEAPVARHRPDQPE
jgi:thiamine biosynthesis lipoprotein